MKRSMFTTTSMAAALVFPALALGQASGVGSGADRASGSAQRGSEISQPSQPGQAGQSGQSGQSGLSGQSSGRITSMSGTVVDLHEFMLRDSSSTLGNASDKSDRGQSNQGQAQQQDQVVGRVFALDSPQGLIILGNQIVGRASMVAPITAQPGQSDAATGSASSIRGDTAGSAIGQGSSGASSQQPDSTSALGNADRQPQVVGAVGVSGPLTSANLSQHVGKQVNITGNLYEKEGVKFLLVNNVSSQGSGLDSGRQPGGQSGLDRSGSDASDRTSLPSNQSGTSPNRGSGTSPNP